MTPLVLLLTFFLAVEVRSQNQICAPSYFFDIQHCEMCLPNCLCAHQETCDTCVPGYTMYLGNCIQCPQASGIYGQCSGCCSRTTGTILSCTDCTAVAGYYSFIYSGRCILSPGCFQIDSNGFCSDCVAGFYEVNNFCFPCHSSCSTCTDSTNCLTCAQGYYWGVSNGGLCSVCSIGCAICDSTGLCTTCLNSFFYSQNFCQACPSNCLICSDASTCTSCSAGILVSNLCILCTDLIYEGSVGCLACQASNNFIVCTKCADTYFLNSNLACTLCSSVITGAIRCTDQNTPTQCQNDANPIYSLRYYLVGITCVLNTKNCQKIADIYGNCSVCYSGYILNSGACTICPFTNCLPTNTSVVGNVCTCTQCVAGYYLSGGLCTACTTPFCSVCAANVCSQCLMGHYFSGGFCVAATVTNCLTALTLTTCTTCSLGFYRGGDNLCYACQSGCSTCLSRFLCQVCNPNYYLSGTICVAIPSNCISVANGLCSLCAYGFYLTSGFCLPCSIELGTLSSCQGMCPIDYYIESLLNLSSHESTIIFKAALMFLIIGLIC